MAKQKPKKNIEEAESLNVSSENVESNKVAYNNESLIPTEAVSEEPLQEEQSVGIDEVSEEKKEEYEKVVFDEKKIDDQVIENNVIEETEEIEHVEETFQQKQDLSIGLLGDIRKYIIANLSMPHDHSTFIDSTYNSIKNFILQSEIGSRSFDNEITFQFGRLIDKIHPYAAGFIMDRVHSARERILEIFRR